MLKTLWAKNRYKIAIQKFIEIFSGRLLIHIYQRINPILEGNKGYEYLGFISLYAIL